MTMKGLSASIKELEPWMVSEDVKGRLVAEASRIGFRSNDSWPFLLRVTGLTWTFNRPLTDGTGKDRKWVGNAYIAVTPGGDRRELLVFNV